jgi:hypothetical protein
LRSIGIVILLAGIPLLAGDPARTNQGGPAVEKRNFSEAEIESTLRALGVTPGPAASSISCDVEDSQGNLVQSIRASNYPAGPFYWLRYQGTSSMTKQVTFVVSPLFTGSPLASQTQTFQPMSTSEVLTPFGIPLWQSGLTAGPWMLVVRNNLGQSASYRFTVQ